MVCDPFLNGCEKLTYNCCTGNGDTSPIGKLVANWNSNCGVFELDFFSLFFSRKYDCLAADSCTWDRSSASNIQAHTTAFVHPISVEFAGVRVHEVPPNGQGIAALLALNILKELGVIDDTKTAAADLNEKGEEVRVHGKREGGGKGGGEGETAYLHRLIEALRLAFADTRWYCADPDKVDVPVEELLGQAYAAGRARLFDPSRFVGTI